MSLLQILKPETRHLAHQAGASAVRPGGGVVFLILAACLAVQAMATPVEGAESGVAGVSIRSLEALSAQWSALRGQIAAEKREWDEVKARLTEEGKALAIERLQLQTGLDEGKVAAQTQETALREQEGRRNSLLAVLQGMTPHLAQAEADLRLWQARLPPPLAAPLNKSFAELPRTEAEAASLGATRRLQVVLSLYTEIEALQGRTHEVKEVLDLGGGLRREMNVLYLGLTRGFGVSSDGAVAAVGRPGPAGWNWSRRDELAPAVRQAVAVFRRESPADLVTLPLDAADTQPGEPAGSLP